MTTQEKRELVAQINTFLRTRGSPPLPKEITLSLEGARIILWEVYE